MNFANKKNMARVFIIASFTIAVAVGLFINFTDGYIQATNDQILRIVAPTVVFFGLLASIDFLLVGIKLVDEGDLDACVGCGNKPDGELCNWCKKCETGGETHA